MYIVFIVLTVIVAILMIGIVLIQKSKGGGLSSQFGGGNQVLGVRGTNSFLEKTTWTLAALILVLSVASSYTLPQIGTNAIRTEAAPQTSNQANKFNTPATNEAPVANPEAAPVAPVEAPAETPAK